MGRALADIALGAGAIGIWFLLYFAARLVTRPVQPAAQPATMDLGPELPAIVSLLVNRWSLTEDAVESTLLDLAARRYFELRQPGDDPMHTTVHLTPRAEAGGLRPYEKMVLDRIRGLAVGGVVPITALTFRDAGQANEWNKRLKAAVVADARSAGLSRRRFGPAVTTMLFLAAAGAAAAVMAATIHYSLGDSSSENDNPGIGGAIFTFAILGAIIGRTRGERHTPAGREVAARWLGVRAWLRGHEQFAELPPAAVTVWDRYLGYGVAVGAARLAGAVLDLGMGDRRLVWSSFGGTWHRVRVRYPAFFPRFGRTAPSLVLRGVVFAALGVGLFKLFGLPALNRGAFHYWELIKPALSVLSPALIALGGYLILRALLDLATERTITGEVLWVQVWKSSSQKEDEPAVPWLHYLAIDDGTSQRTTAWGLPSEYAYKCHDGDTVRVKTRPWSRRITSFEVVGSGRSRELVQTVTEEDTSSLALQMMTPKEAPPLFSLDDISQLLGRRVSAMQMPLVGTEYAPVEGGRSLLMIQSVQGLPGRVAWRANSRGTELPGVFDGAFVSGDRAAIRDGETTVVLTLLGEGRSRREFLPWLLGQAAVGR